MDISIPLSAHLEQFLRDQLASGHFRTEADIVCAALHLLEDHSLSKGSLSSRRNVADWPTGVNLEAAMNSDRLEANKQVGENRKRRSPRGILTDIASNISLSDVQEARREMWSTFPHRDAR
jgi:Arc/MetJ-type ribon-helix-helix transcriptional regulator